MPADPNLLTGLGCALSIFLSAAGSAIATAHAGTYAMRGPDYKSFVPIVQAGVLALYGIIISVILVGKFQESQGVDGSDSSPISQTDGYRYLCAGLSVGLAVLASGWGMAKFLHQLNTENGTSPVAPTTSTSEDAASSSQTEPLLGNRSQASAEGKLDVYGRESFIKTVLAMIFLESIGLYGLIVAVVLIYH